MYRFPDCLKKGLTEQEIRAIEMAEACRNAAARTRLEDFRQLMDRLIENIHMEAGGAELRVTCGVRASKMAIELDQFLLELNTSYCLRNLKVSLLYAWTCSGWPLLHKLRAEFENRRANYLNWLTVPHGGGQPPKELIREIDFEVNFPVSIYDDLEEDYTRFSPWKLGGPFAYTLPAACRAGLTDIEIAAIELGETARRETGTSELLDAKWLAGRLFNTLEATSSLSFRASEATRVLNFSAGLEEDQPISELAQSLDKWLACRVDARMLIDCFEAIHDIDCKVERLAREIEDFAMESARDYEALRRAWMKEHSSVELGFNLDKTLGGRLETVMQERENQDEVEA